MTFVGKDAQLDGNVVLAKGRFGLQGVPGLAVCRMHKDGRGYSTIAR